jgi:selenocysteine lyase/cysteine desulfurase
MLAAARTVVVLYPDEPRMRALADVLNDYQPNRQHKSRLIEASDSVVARYSNLDAVQELAAAMVDNLGSARQAIADVINAGNPRDGIMLTQDEGAAILAELEMVEFLNQENKQRLSDDLNANSASYISPGSWGGYT